MTLRSKQLKSQTSTKMKSIESGEFEKDVANTGKDIFSWEKKIVRFLCHLKSEIPLSSTAVLTVNSYKMYQDYKLARQTRVLST